MNSATGADDPSTLPLPAALVGEIFMRPAQWRTPRDVYANSRGVRALYASEHRRLLLIPSPHPLLLSRHVLVSTSI